MYEPTEAQLNSTSCDDERTKIVQKLLLHYETEKKEKLALQEKQNKNIRQVAPTTKRNLSMANIPKQEIEKLL